MPRPLLLLLDEERQYRQPATKQSKSNRVREIITKIIMVRHHLKKKKVDATSNKQLRQQSSSSKMNHQRRDHDDIEKKKRKDEEDLNRFAGSSEEEEEEDDDDRGDNGDNNKEEDGSENDNHNVDSDDSDNDYDDVYNNPSKTFSERAVAPKKSNIRSTKKASNESDDDDDEVEDGESSEEDEYADKANYERSISKSEGMSRGLAGAMSRILAVGKLSSSSSSNTIRGAKSLPTSSIPNSKPIILSKTTTPIQRLQRQIKNEERELMQKRKNRRADNLSAMRLPLAPTAGMSAEKLRKQKEKMKNVVKSTGATNNKKKKKSIDDDDEDNDGKDDLYDSNALAMANEIESERTHRRIATRGVVALFNAISKHRADAEAKILEREEEKKRRAAAINDMNGGGNVLKKRKKESEENNNSATTKHEFLDMIKKSSMTNTKTVVGGSTTAKVVRSDDPAVPIKQQNGLTSTISVGWNALKDDFMMNSKLKDWDKEISDDDE